MRLLSQVSRVYNEKEYKKFWVVLPNHLIDKLGWKTGQDLEAEVKGDKLVIERD